jgi:hypothetical protein
MRAAVPARLPRTTRPRPSIGAPRAWMTPVLAIGIAAGCLPPEAEEEAPVSGFPALGDGSHDLSRVIIDVIATREDGLNGPRDLDFNPDVPGELWVVNRKDDSTTTIFDAGLPGQETLHLIDPFAMHFMEEVSSLSFARGLKFATCQESRNTYNGQAGHNDFMGPSLWSADLDIYARSNPEAVAANGFDLGSHLDMLHESQLCMGIAWEKENIYWTFDGLAGMISRFDFQQDHGPGFDDHSDGIIQHFADISVERVDGVPSHMVFDREAQRLYVADTGNARILEVDPSTATPGPIYFGFERGVKITDDVGATVREVVPPNGHYLERPSGIALFGELLFVTDNKTATIQVFDRDGNEIDYLDTGLEAGTLMGIRVDAEGHVWVTDFAGNRVLRFRPAA